MSMSRGSSMSAVGLPPVTPPKKERVSMRSIDSWASERSHSFSAGGTPQSSAGTLRDLHYGRMAQLSHQRSQTPAGGAPADRLYTATAGYAGHVPMKETEGLGFGQSWAKGCQMAKQRRTSSLPRLERSVP
jgi:hypothetical protein